MIFRNIFILIVILFSLIGVIFGAGVIVTNPLKILNSNVDVIVVGNDHDIGGLIGEANGIINNSFSTGQVINTDRGTSGALVGWSNYLNIENSYSSSDVTANTYMSGGLIGMSYETIIDNCYSVGSLSDNSAGGLVGRDYDYTTSFNSYWDTDTSTRGTSDEGIGKTTTEMMQEATFVGWDFTNVWQIVEGSTYPTLR